MMCKYCAKDILLEIEEKVFSNGIIHHAAHCKECGRYLKLVPQTSKPIDEVVMPFGKHKGEKLVAIDRDYLWWMLENNAVKGHLAAQIQSLFEGKK